MRYILRNDKGQFYGISNAWDGSGLPFQGKWKSGDAMILTESEALRVIEIFPEATPIRVL